MDGTLTTMIIAVAGLAAFLLVVAALLRGWTDWLALKRAELESNDQAPTSPTPAARIELADLKARVRRLEGIANGVE
jgi:hypothetical protein